MTCQGSLHVKTFQEEDEEHEEDNGDDEDEENYEDDEDDETYFAIKVTSQAIFYSRTWKILFWHGPSPGLGRLGACDKLKQFKCLNTKK